MRAPACGRVGLCGGPVRRTRRTARVAQARSGAPAIPHAGLTHERDSQSRPVARRTSRAHTASKRLTRGATHGLSRAHTPCA